MNFGRELEKSESLVTKSKIRYIDPATAGDNELDRLALEASNQAASDALGFADVTKLDSSTFYEYTLHQQPEIRAGDLVVIQESFQSLNFVYAEPGSIFSNRNGNFHHNDFIGKPFGCMIRSRSDQGYGFVYLLQPTPELWAQSLNHRTQIVQELDQSQVIFQLQLKPNCTVVESGTGSGAMTHAILRTIAPHGHCHTYEFNETRANTARQEFSKNGVSSLVTVHHRDVCGKQGSGGFDLPGQSVDAVFLDLPEPWLAIPHAAYIMKPSSRIASYSPCIEQTHQAVDAFREYGFHSIKTMEFRLMEHYVDEVEFEEPPSAKRPKTTPHDLAAYENGQKPQPTTPQEEIEVPIDAPTTKHWVARPFSMMRGHTAFLTFATAGNVVQPNPLESKV